MKNTPTETTLEYAEKTWRCLEGAERFLLEQRCRAPAVIVAADVQAATMTSLQCQTGTQTALPQMLSRSRANVIGWKFFACAPLSGRVWLI
jgi:hypothetical protein